MWVADNWKDYEVLDCGGGDKFERWGNYKLVRPDPQVIWEKSTKWSKPNAAYFRSSNGGGKWEFYDLPETWKISYSIKATDKNISFNLKPFAFKHTGVFPEQAVNWEWLSSIISKAVESGKAVKALNLFAYTGGATLAMLSAGASVTHVDASKGMVGWAKENAILSNLADKQVRWIVDDCTKFVEREIRRGNHYDIIVMDPPSYGRGPSGELWKIEESIFPFLSKCLSLLNESSLALLLNSYTTGLAPSAMKYMLDSIFTKNLGGKTEAEEIGLRVKATGLVLPEGASSRWLKN